MRALVTGATGFVGQYLCAELVAHGWTVAGTTHGAPVADAPDVVLRRDVRWIPADVRRADDLRVAIDASTPDAIFHLAGLTFVPSASADPGATLEANVVAVGRLLGDVRVRRDAGALDPVVIVAGSGLQYGRHDVAEMPLPESAEQRPADLYAASKAAQEIVALEAWRASGVRVIATRSFNHAGAGQSEQFLLPRLVRRALEAKRAGTPGVAISLGNVEPVRDFLHVRDVVRAYVLLAGRGVPGEVYNVASGAGKSVRELAERVLAVVGVDAKLHSEPSLQRRGDIPVLVGDAGKLRAVTGWSPALTLDDILDDLLRAAPR
ncbi:MAG: GDP-mannose 4,6-dehydratase [Gemmatimonadaceae bacterium]